MVQMRRVRGSRIRRIGFVAIVLGALLVAGIGGGWWWTDRQARLTAHRLADSAAQAWTRQTDSPEDELRRYPGGDPNETAGEAGVAGSVLAVVRAPRLGPDWRMPVQRGTGTQVLREGLGLYDGSPLPGRRGNVAVAGHRTTWGAPLKHLDRLRPDDIITMWTAGGRFDYRVITSGVTRPSDVSVIASAAAGGGSILTLTTCHPEFSARERLFVHAVLVNSVKTH